ncbi:DedA family protein [Patescibacteria group bacterium]|nr:DedA family protein [Patescibacteria group bacterium]
MENFLHLFNLEELIRAAGYVGIAGIIFAESGLFFGFFLPGDSLLFTAGFLASQGLFNIWLLVTLTTIAAIAGDSVGYWFGKKIGPMIFKRPDSFWFSQERVHQAHAFFEKHGAKSIILARFIPAVRTFTPIIAGVAGMHYDTFLKYNIIGGVLWATLLPLLGYYLGTFVPDIDQYIIPIVIAIVVASLIPLAMEFLKKRKNR